MIEESFCIEGQWFTVKTSAKVNGVPVPDEELPKFLEQVRKETTLASGYRGGADTCHQWIFTEEKTIDG